MFSLGFGLGFVRGFLWISYGFRAFFLFLKYTCFCPFLSIFWLTSRRLRLFPLRHSGEGLIPGGCGYSIISRLYSSRVYSLLLYWRDFGVIYFMHRNMSKIYDDDDIYSQKQRHACFSLEDTMQNFIFRRQTLTLIY